MVIASELKRPWQAVLWDAVTNGRPIYVRFSDAVHETIDEVGKLTIDELSDFDTLSAYWELPPPECEKLRHNAPPWKIREVKCPSVLGDDPDPPDFSWLERMPDVGIDDLFLEPDQSEGPQDLTARAPHSCFAEVRKAEGIKQQKAWEEIRQLAIESKGAQAVKLPGFGRIFLKLDPDKPKLVYYKLMVFDGPKDVGHPITRKAFKQAWGRAPNPQKDP